MLTSITTSCFHVTGYPYRTVFRERERPPSGGPDATVSQLLQLLSPLPSTAARAVAVALSEVKTRTGWMILAMVGSFFGNLKYLEIIKHHELPVYMIINWCS